MTFKQPKGMYWVHMHTKKQPNRSLKTRCFRSRLAAMRYGIRLANANKDKMIHVVKP